ncbi:protein Lines homolog 1 isoform 1-T1 [Odontesthes bonariensis]|uniref:protein Lines homolog 1 isoform X1 n=1 Tax=Odontesthes bonariensis TaxID=219752 RepID=UPI003F587E04
MDNTVSRSPQPSVAELFNCLTDTYACLLGGSFPKHSPAHVAGVICSGLRGAVPGRDAEPGSAAGWELTCIGVSAVGRMLRGGASAEVASGWMETLRVLFEDMDLMSQLVHHFQTGDPIISHLAAKTASMCVFYHLNESGTLSSIWQKKCVQAFHSSPPGTELDACLWSLTEVLKKLLKGTPRAAVLGNLLQTFHCSLSALSSKLLLEVSKAERQSWVDLTFSGHWGATLYLLLDLLEALTAAGWMCDTEVCLRTQTIIQRHSSALLRTISCSCELFVKKRTLLLLKRTLFQKLGEDWSLGGAVSLGLKCTRLSCDRSVLAQCVLAAAADDWLYNVQVGPAAFFAGARRIQADEGQKPDGVMLRAISLILLKSVELQIQGAGAAGGVGRASDVGRHLHTLWGFLRQCWASLWERPHLCCWISLLFGEQDDDLMEAANTFLCIFLSYRRCSGLDDGAVLEAACASGCNPHCHFVLLLQSFSFDHSILLDFLISTETCFLEYFVLYLKYLREDWQGFTAACGGVHVLDCSSTDCCAGGGSAVTHKAGPDGVELSSCVQPVCCNPLEGGSNLGCGLRLVEYDSSDESDTEGIENPEVDPVTSVCMRNRCNVFVIKQDDNGPSVSLRQEHPDSSTPFLREWKSTLEQKASPSQRGQTCSGVAPLLGQATGDTFHRAVLCLSELRQVVTRLQAKKLFPYNPSSLLKLLSQVEKCNQLSHLSR